MTPDFAGATWLTSSYSGGNGGSCVEIAFGAWRTSSYSGGNGGNCVEVAVTTHAVGVRDSKHREGGHLTVDGHAWHALLRAVR